MEDCGKTSPFSALPEHTLGEFALSVIITVKALKACPVAS